MRRQRVIPALLLSAGGLVKTREFKQPIYVGDPINAIRIFNDKEVDELVFLDISASKEGLEPNYDLIEEFASEAFFPLSYGGGISSLEQAKRILRIGIEKVVLGNTALDNPRLVQEIANFAGSSSVSVCIDVKKNFFGNDVVHSHASLKNFEKNPVYLAEVFQNLGAGEIILQSVDRDGRRTGYDLSLISKVVQKVDIPLVALGGANGLSDFYTAVEAGASAVSAGSYFIFFGKHQAVLITYPDQEEITELFRGL